MHLSSQLNFWKLCITFALNMNTQHDYGKSSYIKSKKIGIGRNTASDNNNVWK